MAKIRHIAIRCEDVEATAAFFQQVFGLQLVLRRGHGPIDLSDGDVNITLLPTTNARGQTRPAGFEHIGFSVDDADAARQRLLAAGASELNPIALGDAYYESKYQLPEGLVIDVGHWRGTSPLPARKLAAAPARRDSVVLERKGPAQRLAPYLPLHLSRFTEPPCPSRPLLAIVARCSMRCAPPCPVARPVLPSFSRTWPLTIVSGRPPSLLTRQPPREVERALGSWRTVSGSKITMSAARPAAAAAIVETQGGSGVGQAPHCVLQRPDLRRGTTPREECVPQRRGTARARRR
jgi:catechol 2,3-dioxygenase-like lactoylglutathione lyase family enzyme